MKLLNGLMLAGWIAVATSALAPAQTVPTSGAAHLRAAASITLTVTAEGKTLTLSMPDLLAMPQKTITVHNAHKTADETYTGVPLTDVLAKADGAAVGKPLLRSYVKAEGTDKYWVLYSGIEIEAASHGGDVIVATSLGGQALGDNGAFMLVSTEDKKPQRWVRNLAGLTLVKVE